MPSSLRVIVALVLVALAACGGDDAASDDASAAATTTDGAEETTTTTTSGSTTSAPADGAEAPPEDHGHDDEGLGDPLFFVAELRGATEVPGPGDPEGTGRIEVEAVAEGEWCLDMVALDLGSEVTDSHIHFGTEGMSGDVVIPIGAPTATDDTTDTWDDVCVEVDGDLVDEIVAAPDAFYANIHTVDFEAGAVRGQLHESSIFDLTLRKE